MKKKTKFLPFLLLLLSLLLLPTSVSALRKRTRKKRSTGGGQSARVSRGVQAQVRFRPDRRGLLLSFSNFDNLASVSYQLVYESSGVAQGAGGTINLGDTSTKELLFGTCSSGVCSYHKNITNARLSIISTLKNGTKVLKPYRIRV